MSKVISLEVFRPVFLPPDSGLTDEVSTIGRSIFDGNGHSMVALRPSDTAIRTITPGGEYVDQSNLRYYHASLAGLDTKHLGKKLFRAMEILCEDGSSSLPDNLPIERRIGHESLEQTLEAVAEHEYDLDPLDINVGIDEIDRVDYTMLYPGQTIFTLRSSETRNRSAGSMLKRMSHVTSLSIRSTLKRADEFEFSEVADGIPVAMTRCQDPRKLESFARHLGELIEEPLKVELGSVEIKAQL